MDSGSSCKLCQTADGFLHLSRGNHHQISQLVHNNNDLGKLVRRRRIPFRPLFFHLFIVALQIPDVVIRKLLIAICHFGHTPVQSGRRLLGIRNHGNQQMGNTVINTQLHHLRVNQDQLYLIGPGFI